MTLVFFSPQLKLGVNLKKEKLALAINNKQSTFSENSSLFFNFFLNKI